MKESRITSVMECTFRFSFTKFQIESPINIRVFSNVKLGLCRRVKYYQRWRPLVVLLFIPNLRTTLHSEYPINIGLISNIVNFQFQWICRQSIATRKHGYERSVVSGGNNYEFNPRPTMVLRNLFKDHMLRFKIISLYIYKDLRLT